MDIGANLQVTPPAIVDTGMTVEDLKVRQHCECNCIASELVTVVLVEYRHLFGFLGTGCVAGFVLWDTAWLDGGYPPTPRSAVQAPFVVRAPAIWKK